MRYSKWFIFMLALVFVCGTAIASVGVKEEGTMLGAGTDINFVGTGITASGAFGSKTITTAPKVTILYATPATLTTADTGTHYIIANEETLTDNQTITTITLPKASGTTSNVSYKFTSGGSGFVLKVHPDAQDNVFMWSKDLGVNITPVGAKQLRVAKSSVTVITTGTTIEVTMGPNIWYVSVNSETTVDVETWSIRTAAGSE